MNNKQLEEKLDRIIELLEKLTTPDMNVSNTYTYTYPTAPHEQVVDIYRYPWQRLETSSSP